MLLKKQDKIRKIDLSQFFNGEEAYLTIKYINREVWRYANRLTLKTAEAAFYADIVNDKSYRELQKKIDNAQTKKEKDELIAKLNNLANDLLALKYKQVSQDDLNNSLTFEKERNKILIDNAVVKNDMHNFTDEKGNMIELSYEILKDCVFFDFLVNEIISFNSQFDALERK